MLLTLTATSTDPAAPSTDLGWLLHKHPGKAQQFGVSTGVAHVFHSEASDERCTAALLLEVDPIGLVRASRERGGRGSQDFSLGQYVNDRPYAASSMLAVALGKVFRTALAGQCKEWPDLPERVLPLEVRVPSLPARGGEPLVRRLFEPLGWAVEAVVEPRDPEVPRWGDSPYVALTLRGEHRLADALSHLYVLLPVLDNAKHYWVSADEIDKLVRRGGDWLAGHPDRDLIARRYLAHRRTYVRDALTRLDELDGVPEPDVDAEVEAEVAEAAETVRRVTLVQHRKAAVLQAIRDVGARRVVDLGCGAGSLIGDLLREHGIEHVLGVDVSARELEKAASRLRLDRMGERQRARVTLRQSSVTYRDTEIEGADAIVLMEVIEHVDTDRLPALERTVFGHARPGAVVVTTPNVEYNVLYEGIEPGALRHKDHRFEWTRAEFRAWCERVCAAYGYVVEQREVGDVHPDHGSPTQLALFRRAEREAGPVDNSPELRNSARMGEGEAG